MELPFLSHIQKKDAMECKKEGISLFCTAYKVLSTILLNILIPYTKGIMGEYQAGFMNGKCTLDQIHILK